MRTITYYLNTNQVTESDTVYPNAFSADDNTTQLIFDFTGTACATWDKWLDLTMSDYTKDVQSLGTGTIVTFNLGAEHTKKGLLQVNPYAKNGTDKHGFPIYKLTIERQLNNSVVDASAQQSMIDHFDARLSVKAVTTTTLAPGADATASVTTEADGTTYAFGIPQGIQGIQGIQGDKGAQWRGAYSAGTSYVVDDVVSYNGSSYICILASTGNLPTNATYWSLLAQKGDNTTASAVTNTPAGNISAVTVQAAINELDTEKAAVAQEAWQTPTLLNSFVAGTFTPVRYRKDQFGFVRMKGMFSSGTIEAVAFTLPVGYRPAETRYFVIQVGSATTAGIGKVLVTTNGDVTITVSATNASIDSVVFSTD